MNISITEGLNLLPTTYEEGLDVWSSEDGTPGSATYDVAANADFVPADQDFGGALELLKIDSVQKVRWTGTTPIRRGVYLRVRVQVKAVSGPLPSVRIAGYAMTGAGAHVSGLVEFGPAVALSHYGKVVEVSAIVGVGNRPGVDMVWGASVAGGHFGLDLTGTSGGMVRIDDFVIEDVTEAFLRDMIDLVDVRDYGAVGNGVTDDRAAFAAADADADGRTLVVPDGTWLIGSSLTLNSKVRFEGHVTMATGTVFALTRNFDLPTYIDAFGDEVLAFKKGFQALLHYTDHDAFDMCGRRIEVSAPIDMQAAYAVADSFLIRRVIRNGQFYITPSTAWDATTLSRQATYNVNNPYELTAITNISQVEPGSRVSGNGVGREVYVTSVNVGAGKLTLSQPLYGAATTQTYTFTRYRYVLDFLGFSNLRGLEFDGIEFQMNGHASGVMLPPEGENIQFRDCLFTRPKNRGITSVGSGCQDLHIDRCHFASDEQSLPATERQSIAFNVNANDAKIRDSRFQRMGTTMVLNGGHHIISGNHWFQGDEVTNGPRVPGLVLTEGAVATVITGNYIDNCFIEWTNEHSATPDFVTGYSFGGLTVVGNLFFMLGAAAATNAIRIKPYGTGNHVAGMHVVGNAFYASGGFIDRVDKVDTTFAELDNWRCRDVTFDRNTFHGVTQHTRSPATLEFTQNTNATTWTLNVSQYLPFSGNARTVESVVAHSEILDAANARVSAMPFVRTNQGTEEDMIQLIWPVACRGTVMVTARVDKPY